MSFTDRARFAGTSLCNNPRDCLNVNNPRCECFCAVKCGARKKLPLKDAPIWFDARIDPFGKRCYCAPRDTHILREDPNHCHRQKHGGVLYKEDGLRRKYLIMGRRPLPRNEFSKECGPGKIQRSSYSTAKGTRVKAKCVKAKAVNPLGPVKKVGVATYKFKHPHVLRNEGYSQTAPVSVRHAAILRAVKTMGALPLLRHMQLILVRSRNRATNRLGLINMAKDVQWLGKQTNYSGFTKGNMLRRIVNATDVRRHS